MKYCLNCGKELEGKQVRNCSGKCQGQRHKLENGGYEYTKRLRSANPRAYLSRLRAVKDRGSNLSLDFLVSLYEKQNGLCAISKEPMTYLQVGGNKKVPTNISIDQIIANAGYTEDNIQLVCHRVNIMKFDGTQDELVTWCKKVLNSNEA